MIEPPKVTASEHVVKKPKVEEHQEDVIVVSHKKAKKRKCGLLPVKPTPFKKDTTILLTIKNGKWLMDEHIDHAQAMLARDFPYVGGLQAVWVFASDGCESVGTPERGLTDCELFAIAIATSLCYCILPQGCVWMQKMMRGHLSTCFHQGSLTCSPESATGKQNQTHLHVEKVEVFCHCRQPYTKGLFMIECERCKDWFH